MGALERVHIRLTRQQLEFIRRRYGNLSMWVRSKIDREIGAEEVSVLKSGPRTETKQKNQPEKLVWKL